MVIVNAGGGGHFGQDPCARQCDSYPIDEITALARAQVGGGGESAVSLNAIARTMRTSPAALYRYFDNRDDLVAELVVDAYLDLAAHLEAAGSGVGAEQVRAVARAFRAWALASPNTYRLVFESVSGSGLALAADRIRPAAQRSMDVFLRALAGIGLEGDGEVGDELSAQLVAWGERAEHPDLPPAVLHRGVVGRVDASARPREPGDRAPPGGHRGRPGTAVRSRADGPAPGGERTWGEWRHPRLASGG